VPGIFGDTTVRGRTADIDISAPDFVSTVFNSLQFVAIGRTEVRRGPLVFTLDLLYISLEEEETGRLGVDTKVNFDQLFLEFGVGYRLGDWSLGPQPWPRLAVESLAGGRYAHVDGELKLTGTGPLGLRVKVDGSADWLEPFVGARLTLAASEQVAIVVRGDVGGVNVGSDLTWNLVGTLRYRLSRHVILEGGYRVLDIDYDQGSGPTRFAYNVQMRGFIVGVDLHF
jgi:hypothetical protein